MHLATISILELFPPEHAVRAQMDEGALRDLTESIRRVGLLQPIKVRRVAAGYEVVHGHRRLLACQEAGLQAVACLVWEEGESDVAAQKVHENLYREDLSPVEEAGFYAELYDSQGQDVDRVCALVCQTRSHVEARLNLLSGNRNVLQALVDKRVTLGVAQEINKIEGERDQNYYLDWAIRLGATVHAVREWRKNAAMLAAAGTDLVDVAPPTIAPELDAGGPIPCMICGSAEDQYMMLFKMVHSYCLRQAEERAAALAADDATEPK